MTLKLDIENAYDIIKFWLFLHDSQSFSFNYMWINLVQECILVSYFSALVNGSLHGFFKLERGSSSRRPPLSLPLYNKCYNRAYFEWHQSV